MFMQDLSGLCLFCMRPLNADSECDFCKDREAQLQKSPYLIAGTMLNQRYYIGAMRGSDSEGATYIAYDTKLLRPAVVREFFPTSLCTRHDDGVTVMPYPGQEAVFESCFTSFLKLFNSLSRLKGLGNTLNVYDVPRVNGTAYGIYADTGELTLGEWLAVNTPGYISWDQARIMFMPMLSTLLTLNTSNIIHRSISPETILVTEDLKLKLTDFRTADARLAYGRLASDLEDGYAAPEIYSENPKTGSYTDIYSFTAVLYRALIGINPIPAPVRMQNDQMMIPAKFAEQLPPYVINALINGMQLKVENRTYNAEQLRSNLSAAPGVNDPAQAFPSSAARTPYVPPVKKAVPEPQSSGINSLFASEAEEEAVTNGAKKRVPQPEQLKESSETAALVMAQEKKQKLLKIILAVVIGILLVGIALVVPELYKTLRPTDPTAAQADSTLSDKITVIDFTNKNFNALVNDNYYNSLFVFKKVDEYSDTVPIGTVMRQDIAAGTQVELKTCILLTVSAGVKTVAVPDFTGKTYEEAYAALSREGILCEKHSKYNDGTHKPDTVAECVPPAGTSVKAGDTVSVVLWGAIEETTVLETVPAQTVPAETVPVETAAPTEVPITLFPPEQAATP